MAKHETTQINEVSRIAAGTEVKGNLISSSDIRIDGMFEGDLVTTGKLVLGEKAVLKGNAVCTSADVWGNIEGELYVGEAVTFKSTASFKGNLKTVKICIEMGVRFTGNCQIISVEEFKGYSSQYLKPENSAL